MNNYILIGISRGFATVAAVSLLAFAATSVVWVPGAEAASPMKALKGIKKAPLPAAARRNGASHAGHRGSAGTSSRHHTSAHNPANATAGHRPGTPVSPAQAHPGTPGQVSAVAGGAGRDVRRDGVRFDKSPVQQPARGVTFRDPISRTAGVPPKDRAPNTIPGASAKLPAASGPSVQPGTAGTPAMKQARPGAVDLTPANRSGGAASTAVTATTTRPDSSPRPSAIPGKPAKLPPASGSAPARAARPGAVNLTPANRRSGGAASTAVTATATRPDTTSPQALKSRQNSAGDGRVSTYGQGVPVAADNAKKLTEHARKIAEPPK